MIEHPFTIIHVPHSSGEIPAELLPDYELSKEQLELELLNMTDRYTDELFDVRTSKTVMLKFPVSRLVVDPERFSDDAEEGMAKCGMGAVYTCTSDLKRLRVIDVEKKKRLLERFYHPHHHALNALAGKCLLEKDKCLIIDGHSFSSVPLPYEADPERPDICIGTDSFHTPVWLTEFTQDIFSKAGLAVSINRPYSGALVPCDYYRKNNRVISIMLEINRSLYMDERSGEKKDTIPVIRGVLQDAINRIIERVQLWSPSTSRAIPTRL
ncbi:MAG: N-formylglutamate amidohydrolase [Syntrophobacteraceae bacterium]